jgi:serine protease Do
MKTPLRPIVSLLAVIMLVPAARAVDDRPSGWLGLLLADRGASTGSATDPAPELNGVLVRGVVEDGPADEARLRAKDSIIAIDGTAVNGPADLMARVRELDPGSFVTLSVKRQGQDFELTTVLGRRPEGGKMPKLVRGWLGVEAIELPATLRAHFGAPEDAGVLGSKVTEGSPAEDAGIRIGDVIYEADARSVTSSQVLYRLVSEAGVDNAIDVVLVRDGARIVVEPTVARLGKSDQ